MDVQVNSNTSVAVSARFVRFAKDETARVLDRFAASLTRVEVHLSDENSRKGGDADKRCAVEARPSRSRPITVTATAGTVETALSRALGKVRRALTTAFGRRGRSVGHASSTETPKTKKKAAATAKAAATKPAATGTAARKTAARETAPAAREPKKKQIFLARRKAWPSR
jgi:hypothetical protein